jgi:hypoxanthine phosphoribosyltransferase
MESAKEYPKEKFLNKAIVMDDGNEINKSNFLIPKQYSDYIEKVIVSRGLILDRIEKLAYDIFKENKDKTIYFLVVMKGAVKFATYLADAINEIINNDLSGSFQYFFEYITISSYQNDKSTGEVKFNVDEKLFKKLKDQHVILVEDILDTGRTLTTFIGFMNKNYTPASIKLAILVQKMNPAHLAYNIDVEYLGFLLQDKFIVGFGLDYNQHFRDMNHICSLNENGIKAFKIK